MADYYVDKNGVARKPSFEDGELANDILKYRQQMKTIISDLS